jgi:hypothetical protein
MRAALFLPSSRWNRPPRFAFYRQMSGFESDLEDPPGYRQARYHEYARAAMAMADEQPDHEVELKADFLFVAYGWLLLAVGIDRNTN